MLREDLEHLVDVARPLVRLAVAVGLRTSRGRMSSKTIAAVQSAWRSTLTKSRSANSDEVHAVDEREADAAAVERHQRLVALEEVVARTAEQLRPAAAARP